MRVLVTGAAGYVGSVLTQRLLALGHVVRGFDSLHVGGESLLSIFGDPAFSLETGDIRDSTAVDRALGGVDAVVHLAALVGEAACAPDPDQTRAINDAAARRVLDLAMARGIRRFVLVSTCSNYGTTGTDAPVDETAPLNPVSLYAETKVGAERYALGAEHRHQHDRGDASKTEITVLRLATVFGVSPRMRFDLLLNEWVRDAVVNRSLLVYGPQSWRPFVHVRDVAEAIRLVLDAPAPSVNGQVFNIGCGNYQKLQLAGLIREAIPEARVMVHEGRADPRDYRVSFQKAERTLGFAARHSVADGIAEVKQVIESGIIREPCGPVYGNAVAR